VVPPRRVCIWTLGITILGNVRLVFFLPSTKRLSRSNACPPAEAAIVE